MVEAASSKGIFLFNLKISGDNPVPWQSLVENLESIRIAGQILFAMDMAARKKREFGRWRAVGSRTVQWRPGGGVSGRPRARSRWQQAAAEYAGAGRGRCATSLAARKQHHN